MWRRNTCTARFITISEKTWQKLSPADRDAVTKAAREAADWSRNEVSSSDAGQLKEMESKGAKIGRPNLGPWREAVKPVYDQAKAKYGADVDAILADADAVRKALPAK
jgi:TRAP-type C4-dicarboxylate transport system substrate-binding protein